MTISTLARRYQPVVFTFVVLLMVLGVRNYFTLPAQEDPKITIREAVITTRYPGLSPERTELLITKTLEEAIRQIPEIKEIRSSTRAGVSIIHAVVQQRYFELDQIWDDLREKVEEASSRLPEGTQTPIINDDFGDVAVVTAALTADGFSMGEMHDIAKHVRDQLYGVEGTKKVELHGVQDERIFIGASNTRLAELGLSTDQVIAAVRAQNTIRPGGEIDAGARTFIVAPTGNFDSLEQVRETLIALPDSRGAVPLRDLASVTRGTVDPPQRTAYYNGAPAIIFAVSMLDGHRVLEYGPKLREKLQEIEATLPVGYKLDIVTFQADQVGNAVYGVTSNVLQTLGIVLAVVVLFLGVRIGLIVGSIVPAVMLVTLAIMGFAGIPLERMSLATLVIALGLLVDNGIVIAEDFKRRMEEGASRDEALERTGRELALPLLSSTLTTILVFLPLMLAEHEAGEYTRSISLVILISLTTSWVLAMTVTPVLCHRFMKAPERVADAGSTGSVFAVFERGYAGLLRCTLRLRIPFLILMFMALAAGGWAMSKVPQRFFPASDRAQVLITLDLPADVSLNTTDATLQRLFPILADKERFPYLDDFAAYAGYGGPRFVLSLAPLDPAPNKAFIVANLDTIKNMSQALGDLRAMFRAEFPAIQVRVTDMFLGPSDPGVFHIQLKGPDAEVIYAEARVVEAALRAIPGTIDVFQDWENRIPKLVVDIDQARARRNGVTSSDIADTLSAYFSGQRISEYREGDDIFPIVARAVDVERRDVERMETIGIQRSSGSGTVPLIQVADIKLASDFAVIQREDLTRTVTIEGRPLAFSPEDLVPRIEPALEELRATLPPGHVIEYDGIVTHSSEGKAALGANVPLCIGAMFLLLIAQFNSFRRPLIIVASIPLLIVGAAIGLHVMRADFGFMVILGILSLAGIIINNAIVLIDRIDVERLEAKSSDMEAIVTASARRLRPILMTTVTTILGLLPLILTRDPLFYGMASVIAFGLGIGTVMTLGVTPVFYSLFFDPGPSRVPVSATVDPSL
ncbi:efflux RND transporter permease subunit [Mesorhizobium xinjiangense]|uniref:efflux RND transporter permease subunit n=1 Tax=Mesorhizobium xinjiangense TaxID=2678685 RepID=UPI0012EDD9C4|nr:efflux RND transporter permease subunit [Mesorhizobium xinjiangense]